MSLKSFINICTHISLNPWWPKPVPGLERQLSLSDITMRNPTGYCSFMARAAVSSTILFFGLQVTLGQFASDTTWAAGLNGPWARYCSAHGTDPICCDLGHLTGPPPDPGANCAGCGSNPQNAANAALYSAQIAYAQHQPSDNGAQYRAYYGQNPPGGMPRWRV